MTLIASNPSNPYSLVPLLPTLPTEIWLQILEQGTIYEAMHLWTSVRLVSRQFKGCVERLFISVYLPKFSISLALPRRDPGTGALKWHSTPIPGAQITMSFDHVSEDQQQMFLNSPVVLRDKNDEKTVEELRDASILPKERLEAAPPWVHFNHNTLTGLSMKVPVNIDWDNERKVWTWQMNWKRLVSQFYQAKGKPRVKHLDASQNDKKWAARRR